MSHYQCRTCNQICYQKSDIRKHLSRKYRCKRSIFDTETDKTDIELDRESLIKITVKNDIKNMVEKYPNLLLSYEKSSNEILEDNTKDNKNKHYCNYCDKYFHNKSNINKHQNTKICNKNKQLYISNINKDCTVNNIINNINTNNNNIQKIGVQNNYYVINDLRGFDQDWNISLITQETKEKLLLSDKKFTNTLNNILKNKDNCNVVIKNDNTGYVYIDKKKDYEAKRITDICEESMDKIHKYLTGFFKETINNNINDIKVDILEKEMNEVNNKFSAYKESLKTYRGVNQCFSNIFKDNNEVALNNLIEIEDNKSKYIDEANNEDDEDFDDSY
jgi:hypothetical protein